MAASSGEVMINLNPKLLQAKGLSPADVLQRGAAQYLVLPSGTAKIGAVRIRRAGQRAPATVRAA